jgi:chemotaxis protein histidine kinase CheA
MSSLEGVVGTLRRSDARSRALPYVVHALLGAAAWVAIVLVAARIFPLETRLQPAALGISVILVAAGIAWLVIRPRPDTLMQRADLHLGLQERLSTAWERRSASGVMDGLLLEDALLHAERDRLKRAFPVRINRREAAALAIVAATAVALFLLPNPMDQVLLQRQADRTSQAKAASAIREVEKKIAASTKSAPVAPQVQQILSDTQKKIAQAPDPRQAIAPISPAEQRLQQLSDPQTAARSSSAQNLANALSTTTAGQAAAQALANSPSQGAQALRNLAAQLQSLTPAQRAQLATALADAAQHAQDPAMAATLQRASSALSSGDIASAGGALSDLATQMDSLQDQQNNDQAIAAAINGLEAARQGLAAQANSDATGGGGTAAASPAAAASAAAGNGSGNGTGTGTGSGSGGTGNGNGGTGGQGGSGSGSGSGSAANPGERLYVPGQPIPGQVITDPAPLGPGQDVPLTPYTQVVQAYQQAALDATGQSLIPGSERDLVREYFSRLGESAAAP